MAIDRDKILQAAQSLVEKKRYDKAIVEYQKLVAVDHKDARTLLKIGELYLKLEQYEPAVAAFEQVARIHAGAGFALKAIAVYKQAREVVQKHVPHLGERFGYLLTRTAELYVELKLHNDAVLTYEEIAGRLEASGRERDTIDVLRKIVELDPQNPQRVYRFAEALVRVGDVDGAMAPYTTAAEALFARGQRDDALAVAERALTHRPDQKLARLAAVVYLERGFPNDGAAALVKIQLCYKQAPKDLATLDLLAKALYALRQPMKALDVHKEAARIARDTGNAEAFDFHMQTLCSRAPNDEVVRKLAAQWSKAPRSMLEPPTPPPRAPPVTAPMPAAPEPPPPATSMSASMSASTTIPMQAIHGPSTTIPMQAAPGPPPPSMQASSGPRTVQMQAAPGPPPMPAPPLTAPMPAMPLTAPMPAMPLTAPMPAAPDAQAAPAFHMPAPSQRFTPQGPPPLPPRGTPPQRITQPQPGPPPLPPTTTRVTPVHAPPLPAHVTPVHAAPPPLPPTTTRVTPIHAPPAPPIQLDDLDAEALRGAPPAGVGFGQLDHYGAGNDPTFPPEERVTAAVSSPFPHDEAPASLGGRGRFDEDAIEEVEFFVSQGMFEDALAILDEQLARLPNHPLLLDRKRDVEAQLEAAATGDPAPPWTA